MAEKRKQLWACVRRLILENKEGIAKSEDIRDSWYIVAEWLTPLIGKEITREDYDWFAVADQGYATYRDDMWPSLEQREGLERPNAKPIGIVYDRGIAEVIEHLENVWSQARGFVFVEKAGEAKRLKSLSEFGWCIAAGQGFATRLIRKLLKGDEMKRPVVVVHDQDKSGLQILKALAFKTRRTRHLDIALGERIVDIGLTEEDAKKLKLRSRPEPKKYKGVPRWELASLSVLSVRWGIKNPLLAYVVAKMRLAGIKPSPLEKSRAKLIEFELRWKLKEAIAGTIKVVAKRHAKAEGSAVNVELPSAGDISVRGLELALHKLAGKLVQKATWLSEEDYENEAMKLTNRKFFEVLK